MNDLSSRRHLLAGLGTLAAAGAAPGTWAQPVPPQRFVATQALLDRYIAAHSLSGGVVALTKRGSATQFVSAGTLAFDTQAPARPDSLYRLYSNTKPVVGVAAMILIQEGRLRLDQPLSEILPAFADMKVIVGGDVSQMRPAAGPILIRHLITHTSGLSYHINNSPMASVYRANGLTPGNRGPLPPGAPARVGNLEEFGARLASLPLEFDPGTRWQYSFGADLMGLVIQRVTGKSFWDFLRTRIFEPLRMPDTDFMVPPSKLARLTTVYNRTPQGMAVSDDRTASPFAVSRDLPSGGGGLVSSARDYARFCAMLANEGELDGRRILSVANVRLARSNLMPPGPVFGMLGRPNGFGALMQVILPGGEFPGAEPAGSYGWSGAAGTSMWVDPVNEVSVVLMVQFMPAGAFPIYLEARQAAYRDLRASGVIPA